MITFHIAIALIATYSITTRPQTHYCMGMLSCTIRDDRDFTEKAAIGLDPANAMRCHFHTLSLRNTELLNFGIHQDMLVSHGDKVCNLGN